MKAEIYIIIMGFSLTRIINDKAKENPIIRELE